MEYKLTLNEKQAAVVQHALEIYARLGIGQFRNALELLPLDGQIPEGWWASMDAIGSILSGHTKHGVNGWTSSLSIHSKDVSEDAQIAWDVHQVIRHRLSWDRAVANGIVESADSERRWPMVGVYYDDPHLVSNEPIAKMEKADA